MSEPISRRAADRIREIETREVAICGIDCLHPAPVAQARARMRPEADLRDLAGAFKALAHPHRLRILRALDGRELCVCDLSHLLGLSMSGTSQQLRTLRDLGAIDYRTAGKLVFYRLADRFWLEVSESVADHLGQATPAAPPPTRRNARSKANKSTKQSA